LGCEGCGNHRRRSAALQQHGDQQPYKERGDDTPISVAGQPFQGGPKGPHHTVADLPQAEQQQSNCAGEFDHEEHRCSAFDEKENRRLCDENRKTN
jgi:hypothetical protein